MSAEFWQSGTPLLARLMRESFTPLRAICTASGVLLDEAIRSLHEEGVPVFVRDICSDLVAHRLVWGGNSPGWDIGPAIESVRGFEVHKEWAELIPPYYAQLARGEAPTIEILTIFEGEDGLVAGILKKPYKVHANDIWVARDVAKLPIFNQNSSTETSSQLSGPTWHQNTKNVHVLLYLLAESLGYAPDQARQEEKKNPLWKATGGSWNLSKTGSPNVLGSYLDEDKLRLHKGPSPSRSGVYGVLFALAATEGLVKPDATGAFAHRKPPDYEQVARDLLRRLESAPSFDPKAVAKWLESGALMVTFRTARTS